MTTIRHLAATAALLLAAAGAQAQQVGVHDPVMAREGGTYYVFATGQGISVFSSQDMKTWRPEGRVFHEGPAWATRAAPGFKGHIWAPDIVQHDGRYLLYYSVSAFGKNTSAIGVTSNRTLDPRSPDYQWEDQGVVLQSVPGRDAWNAIDSAVVGDDEGNGWMAFGSFWTGLKLVKLDRSWTRLTEPQEWHTIAAREGAAFRPDHSGGPAQIEAPFIFRTNGFYYLFASWGLCCQKEKSTYHVVVGRSKTVTGPYLDRDGKDMAKGGGSLVIAGSGAYKALGHNSAYSVGGRDVLVLHAYETADNYRQKPKILDIGWDAAGWPVVDPTQLDSYQSTLLPADGPAGRQP